MKNLFLLILGVLLMSPSFSQAKLTPVLTSKLTGITLPAGSKQDNRMFNISGAKMLLEMESDKMKVTLHSTEVLLLPTVGQGGFNTDSLQKNLVAQGWGISVVESDKKYAWLKKGNRNVIMYFAMKTKETGLYFAEAGTAPVPPSPANTPITNTSSSSSTPQKKGDVAPSVPGQTTQQPIQQAGNQGFSFTTTNFDDGWTSTVREDWVEVVKGNAKVLLHYPKDGTVFPADPAPMTTAAWNILVAPRYSNLRNYRTCYIATYNRPYLATGYATENATGQNVFIVFFHQGQNGWLEFVGPDKNSFVQLFRFDAETIQYDSNDDLLVPFANMIAHNKFGIAASDFAGKWTSDFTGIQQLYYVYTGQYAGMNINQSNEEFIFNNDHSYSWKLLAVNGTVGNVKAIQVGSSGQFSVVNNWQIYFSKIETGPRTFHAFWSCIKGARVLNLLDANSPGSGIYTKYGLAK